MRAFSILHTTLAIVVLAAFASAQFEIVRDQPGPFNGDQWGFKVAIVGDVDGDGKDDYLVGAPLATNFGSQVNAGRVYMYSGATGAELWFNVGPSGSSDMWGSALAAAGDVNNDGIPDVIVGASQADTNGTDNGRVEVLDGATGANLMTLDGNNSGDRFGFSVCGVGDVNGDGHDDVAVGAPLADPTQTNSGQVTVWSGLGGGNLATFNGPSVNGAELGFAIDGGKDVTGDGVPDLIAGVPGDGSLFVYDLSTFTFIGGFGGAPGFYASSVALVGDLTGDGRSEICVGDPAFNSFQGRILVYDPMGPGVIILPTQPGPPNSLFLGVSCAALGDWDGQGLPDIAVGTTGGASLVRIYRGEDLNGTPISMNLGPNPFGEDVRGGGDVNGDGLPDLIIGNESPTSGPGRIWIVGAESPYPGSDEDLILEMSKNGGSFEPVKIPSTVPGDLIQFRMSSPGGALSSSLALVLAQPFSTATPIAPVGGFPELHVNPNDPFPIFALIDGTNVPVGSGQVAAGVTTVGILLPAGLTGFSLMFQGLGVTGSATNGIFATTNGIEVVL